MNLLMLSATRRDLARALFLHEIGALWELKIVKIMPSEIDTESFFLLSLLGARVEVTTEIHKVQGPGGIPAALIPTSRTATAVFT